MHFLCAGVAVSPHRATLMSVAPCVEIKGDEAAVPAPQPDPPPPTRCQIECRKFRHHRLVWLVHIVFTFHLSLIFLEVSPGLLFFCLAFSGFVYVAGCNEDRVNMIGDREPDPVYFPFGPPSRMRYVFAYLLTLPAIYLAAARFTLADPTIYRPDATGRTYPSVQVNAIYTSDADLWEEWWKYFSRNWLCYVLPFFLGCHFTYLDHVPTLQQIELSGRGLKQMGPLAIVALLLAVLLALASIGFHLWLLFDAGLLLPYGVGVLAFAALFAALAAILICGCKTHKLHVHHYAIFLPVLPITRFDHPVSAITQALCFGVFTEGAARWGIGPNVEPVDESANNLTLL